MRHQTRIRIVSLSVGFGLAGLLQVVALVATQAGYGRFAQAVDWPAAFVRILIPDSASALFAGFPLGVAIYSMVAYLILKKALATE